MYWRDGVDLTHSSPAVVAGLAMAAPFMLTNRRKDHGRVSRDKTGGEPMYWRKGAAFTLDCAAVLAGAVIASPFLLILAAPFLVGI